MNFLFRLTVTFLNASSPKNKALKIFHVKLKCKTCFGSMRTYVGKNISTGTAFLKWFYYFFIHFSFKVGSEN